MPAWSDLLNEFQSLLATEEKPGLETGAACDALLNKYISALSKLTGRNVIVYYSAFLQKPNDNDANPYMFMVNDNDMNGFMSTIHGLNTTAGLDLLLHTPGGNIAATESLVKYLRSKFGNDIHVYVPHLAMSAGTMIASASKKIVLGKHSSLGPIDPQFGSISAVGVIQEVEFAMAELKAKPETQLLWRTTFEKYPVGFLNECRKSILQSREMVERWMVDGMFYGEPDAAEKSAAIANSLCDKDRWKSHSRHISIEEAAELGLKVEALEADHNLQEAVLTAHHACVLTLSTTTTAKMLMNQNGVAYLQFANQ